MSCTGKVEKKENPFFKIAKQVMDRKKNHGQAHKPANKQQGDPNMVNCKGRVFDEVDTGAPPEFADYQEIKVQETFRTLKPGLIPRSICVILQNTLVETCKPGDDVMLTGSLIQRWKMFPPMPGCRPVVELALLVNNVEILNKKDF